MIHLSSSPLRVSLIGGGTDFETFYKKHQGGVVSFTINKYVYVIIKEKYDETIKLSYSKNENPKTINDIKHNLIKKIFEYYKIKKNIELVSIADIHSKGTGLGSSSAFTLATMSSINSYLNKKIISKNKLAEQACIIEIKKNKSPIGVQDQYASAYGGLNFIKFSNKNITISKIKLESEELQYIKDRLFLFNTGITRNANLILNTHEKKIRDEFNIDYLKYLRDESFILNEQLLNKNFNYISNSINKSWELKQKFNFKTKNKNIDKIINQGMKYGASGAKLLGAGKGGFILFFVPKNKKNFFLSSMGHKNFLNYNFDHNGTKLNKIF